MSKLLILTFALTSFTLHAAENNFVFLGGGGEPLDKDTTQFDGSIGGVGKFFQKNKDYQTTVSFNGGHSRTENSINSNFQGADIRDGFTEANYNQIIQENIQKLSATPPEIPAGGKLLIFLNTHGGESDKKTHRVSLTRSQMNNPNSLNSSGTVSLDALEQLSKLALEKGVKLAIVDASCHSGNSLSLANPATCVISASGSKHYGYTNFAEAFGSRMKKGKNLEEIFLDTRKSVRGLGFPMISSPEGKAVQDDIYPLLTPYMYYHGDYRGMELDKIDTYLKLESNEVGMCKREMEYNHLLGVLDLIENVRSINERQFFGRRNANLSKLREKIAAYKANQDVYMQRLSELNVPNMDRREQIPGVMNTYTHRELLTANYGKWIADKEAELLTPNLTPARREQLTKDRTFFMNCQSVKERVIRENPQYAQQTAIIDELKNNSKFSISITSGIAREAQVAYEAYYKLKQNELQAQQNPPKNPCKDFVL